MNYKGNRGTLIHYHMLNQFADEELDGKNEERAREQLKTKGDWQRHKQDLYWAEEAFDNIRRMRGIDEDSVLNVECFVENTDVGYAGQFDLLYIDNEGDIVLSDLKTSKSVYPKHKMQLVAYANAINVEPDKLEVIRMHPDSESWQTSHSSDWDESVDELYSEFCELRESLNEDLAEIAEHGVDDG